MRWFDAVGTVLSSLRIGIGKAILSASGLSAERTFTLPDTSGLVPVVQPGTGAHRYIQIVDNTTDIELWLNAGASNPSVQGFAFGDQVFSLGQNLTLNNGSVTADRFTSAETSLAPFVVNSDTVVTSLNADQLDGYHASAFEAAGAAAAALISAYSYTDDGIEYIDAQLFEHFVSSGVHGVTGSVVGTTDTQTLTGKTISAASNTITVSASGVTATNLNDALTEIQANVAAIAIKGKVTVLRAMPPGADYALADIRVGGSTPVEGVGVWDFTNSANRHMDFLCVLEGYSGGGLTFTLPWMATTATSGTVRWGVAIRRLADDAEDVDTSQTYDFNTVDDSPGSASGEVVYPTVTFTDGSDMDSWANGEMAIVRVRRDTSVGGNMSGDAELLFLIGRET